MPQAYQACARAAVHSSTHNHNGVPTGRQHAGAGAHHDRVQFGVRAVVLQHEVNELRGQAAGQQVLPGSLARVCERQQDAKVLVELAPVHVQRWQHGEQGLQAHAHRVRRNGAVTGPFAHRRARTS
jgi:hypothetical protein